MPFRAAISFKKRLNCEHYACCLTYLLVPLGDITFHIWYKALYRKLSQKRFDVAYILLAEMLTDFPKCFDLRNFGRSSRALQGDF